MRSDQVPDGLLHLKQTIGRPLEPRTELLVRRPARSVGPEKRDAGAPTFRCVELLRDLPYVSAGVAEARGADAPWPVHRPVEQFDAPFSQLLAGRVDVLDAERELGADTVGGGCDWGGSDQAARLARSRLTSVSPNLNTAEFPFSKKTGSWKTS